MKARERQKQRRQERDMVSKSGRSSSAKQAAPEGSFKMPEIRIKGARFWLLIPLGLVVIASVVFALRLLTPAEEVNLPHAIWLNADWSYHEHNSQDLLDLSNSLNRHDVGTVFLYVSSLKADGTWSGLVDGR